MALRVGANKAELGAKPGLWLGGYAGRTSPATGVLDPLMVRAVAIEGDEAALLLVSLDLIGLELPFSESIRAAIAERVLWDKTSVAILCTHTHAGPATMRFRGNMGRIDPVWMEEMAQRVVDAAVVAVENLEPVSVCVGEAQAPGVAMNRDPAGGPVDETVTVVQFSGEFNPLATLVHFACHPVVLGPKNLHITAEFPGALMRRVDKWAGVGLYLQGPCGDINPQVHLTRSGYGFPEDVDEVGESLHRAVKQAVKKAEPGPESVSVQEKAMKVPLGPVPTTEELDRLQKEWTHALDKLEGPDAPFFRDVHTSMLGWISDVRRLIEEGSMPTEREISVWQASFAGIDWVGLPMEVYTAIGLEVRPKKILEAANGLLGYVATDEAWDAGGYGPASSHRWFPDLPIPIARGTDRLVVDTIRTM